ncbi:MAG TPA: S1 family peptidase [Polyangiaceae bacterium]|nr:S1 family peptidase [Polyangiaceae bacterium]
MNNRRWLWALLSLTSLGCWQPEDAALTEGELDELGTESQAIVRGEIEDGVPQVMALLVARLDGGQALCSGTLFAPRAILTAGHCLDQAASVLAYFGNDFDADFPQLFDPSVPPENWRFGVEWRQHPRFDLATMDSDVAVVHVDRDLPFAPLPLSFDEVGPRRIGDRVEILGYGAEESDESNAGGPGAFIKRSGQTVFEGTPRRFPLPPNPHPGLTNRRIRNQLMQLDGSSPHANACFGDSGGPALMRTEDGHGHRRGHHGQQKVVGVFSWTGDFCEDFSYYVRLDQVAPFVIREAVYARHR